ncbi:hypothetical protein ABIE44_001848 [Marmoricola sp. OAE513]|uniref:hypothetical protein n=1 Tax=Marmoricola sp. OAE513 TaxID=2817894 RepID=UPI001AEA8375
MKRALTGVFLAALVVLGLPAASTAAGDSPVVSVKSASYSSQPRPYTVTVFNRLDNSKLTAKITNSGIGTRSMSCRPAGAINGLGTWRCTLGSGRLGLGSIRVTATAKSGSTTRTGSGSGSISSRFRITGTSGSVNEGGSFTVRGNFDGGAFGVRARVTSNGGVVAGQSGSSCSTSGTSFTCSLRAAADIGGTSGTHRITVTESGGGGSRSASTSINVVGKGTPGTPSFSSPKKVSTKKQPLTIKGRTSAGGLTVQLLVDPSGSRNWSNPAATCTSSGSGAWSCRLTDVLATGKHTIVARVVDPSDPGSVSPEASFAFSVTAAPTPSATPTPTPSATPTPEVEQPPVTPEEPEEPEVEKPISGGLNNLLELLVLALAVLSLSRPGALSRVRPASSASFTGRNPGEESELETVGWGDQSPTWAAFGTDATDFWSRTAPPVVARFSPFLGRLSVDGVGIRAMLGSLWWLFPIGGVALGIAGAQDTGGQAVPPALGILVGIIVLGALDASAGFLASLAFTVGVAGNLDKHGIGVVIVLGFLWTGLPLIASLLRPIRRAGQGWRFRWDRLADVVIAALVCGWLAQRIAAGMDVIAGTGTGLPADASSVAVITGLAVAGRVLLGWLVDVAYPERLRATEVFEDMPEPRTSALVLGFLVRTALFALVGIAVIGSCWQLWVGVLLFAVPDLLAAVRSRSALAPTLRSGLPAGLTQVLVLVVWCSLVVAFAISKADGDLNKLKAAFVAAAVLPAIFASVQVFADDDQPRPATTWRLQLVGVAIVVATAALALHGWNY